MRLVIQRVNHAKVTRAETGEVVGEIEKGLFVLVGVKTGDKVENATALADKLLKLRVMGDETKKMNLSVIDTKSSLLIVSQFTLYANTKDGNRPSFIEAAGGDEARALYEYFVDKLKKSVETQTGSFGDYMKISSELDGPVTIIMEN